MDFDQSTLLDHLRAENDELRDRWRRSEEAGRLARSQADMLLQTLDLLQTEPNLDAYLGQVLQVLVEKLEGLEGSVWMAASDGRELRRYIDYSHGSLRLDRSDTDPPIVLADADIEQLRRDLVHFDGVAELATKDIYAPYRTAIAARGIRSIVSVPAFFGGALRGLFSVRRSFDRARSEDDAELARRLVQQGTLAIELLRLAEERQQAAIREERLRAEKERAAILSHADRALREALDTVATDSQVDSFLKQVVATMTRQLGALSASLWLFDATMTLSDLHYEYPCPADQDVVEYKGVRVHVDADGLHSVFERRPYVIPDLKADPNVLTGRRERLNGEGVRSLLVVPMVLRNRAIGCVSLRYPAPPELTADELSVAQTLGHQATFGIALTELSENARKTAVLDERTRVARELHDTLAQVFTGLALQLDVARSLIADTVPNAAEVISRCGELARQGLTEARRSVLALQPQDETYGEIASTLADTVRRMTEGTKVRAEVEVHGPPRRLDPALGLNLLRIGQEAVTNALRHARPTRVSVCLEFRIGRVILSVMDDGRGIPEPVRMGRPCGGFGLANIRHRVEQLSGRVHIEVPDGGGTRIVADMPA